MSLALPKMPRDVVIRRPRLHEIHPVLVKDSVRPTSLLSPFLNRPPLLFMVALLVFTAVGTGLLMLAVASVSGDGAPFLTALFTATSAITTTGLTLETTATYWSFLGQLVTLVLMFLGALGFMAAVTFLLIAVRQQFLLPERLLIRGSLGFPRLNSLLPLVRNILILDLVVTAVGVFPLFWRFHHYLNWHDALWQGVYTSVSAFNTAGFDIVGPGSLTPYQGDPYILGVSTLVSCVGALGYSGSLDLLGRKRWNRLALNTRLVIVVSLVAWVIGGLAFLLFESSNPATLGTMSVPLRVMTAFFNGISGSTTTGFSTIDFGQVLPPMLLIMIFLMFVGGAAGSTAGGTKVNTLSVLLVVTISSLKGRSRAQVFSKELPNHQVMQAVAVWLIATFLVGLSTLILLGNSNGIPTIHLVFEAVSAFGTVGLSDGAILHLPASGLYIMTLLMLVGRVGVLTLILAMVASPKPKLYDFATEEVTLG
jgi:trk system potassium uptake protein TrkH